MKSTPEGTLLGTCRPRSAHGAGARDLQPVSATHTQNKTIPNVLYEFTVCMRCSLNDERPRHPTGPSI